MSRQHKIDMFVLAEEDRIRLIKQRITTRLLFVFLLLAACYCVLIDFDAAQAKVELAKTHHLYSGTAQSITAWLAISFKDMSAGIMQFLHAPSIPEDLLDAIYSAPSFVGGAMLLFVLLIMAKDFCRNKSPGEIITLVVIYCFWAAIAVLGVLAAVGGAILEIVLASGRRRNTW